VITWRDKAYDELPALSVRKQTLRRSLRLVTVAWMYGVVWMSCVSGDQVRSLAKMLGFNDFTFGLMAALPFLTTLGQLQAAIAVERTGFRKLPFIFFGVLHRLLWIAVAAVPLIMGPSVSAIIVVLFIMGLSHLLGQMSAPAWWTWMGDLIPRRIRGRYFARRAQVSQVVQLIAIIVMSLLLDWSVVPGAEETYAGQPRLMWMICAILAVGGIFGAIDILTFRRIREVIPARSKHYHPVDFSITVGRNPGLLGRLSYYPRLCMESARVLLLSPLKDRVFRNYVGYGATITFTITVSGLFFWRYASEWLGFSKLGTNSLFLVIGPLAATLTARGWGKLLDRFGRRTVLIIATIGTIFSLLPWFIAQPDTPVAPIIVKTSNSLAGIVGSVIGRPGWAPFDPSGNLGAYLLASLGCAIGGASWMGVNLAQTAVMLGFSDGNGRSIYVAASSVLINLGGVLGGLTGGVVAQLLVNLQSSPLHIGPLIVNNWMVTFLISLVTRAGSLIWLRNMPDPGGQSVRNLLRFWGTNTYNLVASRLFYPLRLFGWSGGYSADGRQDPKNK